MGDGGWDRALLRGSIIELSTEIWIETPIDSRAGILRPPSPIPHPLKAAQPGLREIEQPVERQQVVNLEQRIDRADAVPRDDPPDAERVRGPDVGASVDER